MDNKEHTNCGTSECCKQCIPVINNRSHNPDEREWEYDGSGVRVYKGTNQAFKFDDSE